MYWTRVTLVNSFIGQELHWVSHELYKSYLVLWENVFSYEGRLWWSADVLQLLGVRGGRNGVLGTGLC